MYAVLFFFGATQYIDPCKTPEIRAYIVIFPPMFSVGTIDIPLPLTYMLILCKIVRKKPSKRLLIELVVFITTTNQHDCLRIEHIVSYTYTFGDSRHNPILIV